MENQLSVFFDQHEKNAASSKVYCSVWKLRMRLYHFFFMLERMLFFFFWENDKHCVFHMESSLIELIFVSSKFFFACTQLFFHMRSNLHILYINSWLQVPLLKYTELKKLLKRISTVLPLIEAAQPPGSSGIEALGSLNAAIERANRFSKFCSRSSKLFLVRDFLNK